jgi:hypothetical protein
LALIHNPMGELTGPLHRVEASLAQLCGDLGALDVLPSVDAAVEHTNERLARVEAEVALARATGERALEALEAIRAELATAVQLLVAGAAGSAARTEREAPSDAAT